MPAERLATRRTPPPIVALPGTLCAPAIFDRLAHALRGHGRFELRALSWLTGPGPWDVPHLAATVATELDAAGDPPVVLCGHSTGGAIALQVAIAYPELVAALVLLDTGAHMNDHGDVGVILDRMSTRWGGRLRESVIDRSFHLAPIPEDRARFVTWADTVRQDAALQVLRSQRELDLSPHLASLRLPVLVVHGRHDPTRTVRQAGELAAAIPKARLVVLDAGHSPMYERPVEVAAEIVALVAESG